MEMLPKCIYILRWDKKEDTKIPKLMTQEEFNVATKLHSFYAKKSKRTLFHEESFLYKVQFLT